MASTRSASAWVTARRERCRPNRRPGWKGTTLGVTREEDLPPEALAYLARIEELVGVPIDVISTGPDRDQTIIRRHPFG
jgi:adenylosuccinate synthase